MTVHEYPELRSGTVYDLTQTQDSIKDGDILVLPLEGIVGIFSDVCPIAITVEHGKFHKIKEGHEKAFRDEYPMEVREAEIIAINNGWNLALEPPF